MLTISILWMFKLMNQEGVSTSCLQLAFCGCSSGNSCINRRCTCVRMSLGCSKAWFPYRCICRICRVYSTKKIHRTDITLWKPPVQMLNTKETTDTTCCTNEFYRPTNFFRTTDTTDTTIWKPGLRTFAPKSSYGEIFFISRLELVDKVLTPKMKKKMGVTDFVSEKMAVEKCLNFDKSVIITRCSLLC